jgi:hypothetical protein
MHGGFAGIHFSLWKVLEQGPKSKIVVAMAVSYVNGRNLLVTENTSDPGSDLISLLPCQRGSMRMASFSPDIRVDAMCDHVAGIPNGRGFGVTIGMRSVTWRSARRVEGISERC